MASNLARNAEAARFCALAGDPLLKTLLESVTDETVTDWNRNHTPGTLRTAPGDWIGIRAHADALQTAAPATSGDEQFEVTRGEDRSEDEDDDLYEEDESRPQGRRFESEGERRHGRGRKRRWHGHGGDRIRGRGTRRVID